MFSFFKSQKDKLPEITVFSTRVQLYKWLMDELMEGDSVVCFFDETRKELQTLFNARTDSPPNRIYIAESLGEVEAASRVFIADLYPLHSPYIGLIEKIKANGVQSVYLLTYITDPFFEKIGGDRMAHLMSRLGMKEEESISHSMITKAVESAQKKLGEKVAFEKKASSASEWFALNSPTA